MERTGDEGWSDFREMLRWLDAGQINPVATIPVPFGNALDAFHQLLDRRHSGKRVIVLDGDAGVTVDQSRIGC